jgi:putative sterol carrier protein
MDDMTRELLPRLPASDLIVYATPLYFSTMNATMSIFRERMLPLFNPFIEKRGGRRVFSQRYKLPPAVWLSACAVAEKSEFDALSNFLQSTHHPDTPIIAEIYRTSAEALRHPVFKQTLSDILEATSEAGGELVRSMNISPDTMARIRQPLADPATLTSIGNLTFKTCIAEKMMLKEFLEKGQTPRPDSLEAFMAYSVLPFHGDAADGKKVIIQFRFSGEVEDSCYFTFERGRIKATAGTSHTCDIAIETPFELWMDIITGKADGREMFMQHKYQVEGDLSLMLEIFQKKEN